MPDLIFELSREGREGYQIPAPQVKAYKLKSPARQNAAKLPCVSENEVVRHFVGLSTRAFGVDSGCYPLGSCTMKYNPKVNEKVAAMEGFCRVHPAQNATETAGTAEAYAQMKSLLCEICGMDAFTLLPAAGAHGEFCGMLIIKEYFKRKGDTVRRKIIVPDSSHGTNPASANMCGFEVVTVPSDGAGGVDLKALAAACGEDTAGFMLTNPNTVGLFDVNIQKITQIVHKAGGLCYYDGANLNAIMGVCRPGDMGFDVMHVNVHKTFSAPHGGGGPGSGPVGVKAELAQLLPEDFPAKGKRGGVGKMKSYIGNLQVVLKGLAYIKTLGAEGLKDAAQLAVLNANYLCKLIEDVLPAAYKRRCMHEFVATAEEIKEKHGVSALDISKALIDYKMHPPTMYFPLIVHEALMFEPTETESKETLEKLSDALHEIVKRAKTEPDALHRCPTTTPTGRADEVRAAREMVVTYLE